MEVLQEGKQIISRGVPSVQRHEKNCLAVHRSLTARNCKATGPSDRADGKSKKNNPHPTVRPSPLAHGIDRPLCGRRARFYSLTTAGRKQLEVKPCSGGRANWTT